MYLGEPRGAKRVTISGNVLCDRVSGVSNGFVVGNGLTDFTDLSWDGNKREATLSHDCPFIGQADKSIFRRGRHHGQQA